MRSMACGMASWAELWQGRCSWWRSCSTSGGSLPATSQTMSSGRSSVSQEHRQQHLDHDEDDDDDLQEFGAEVRRLRRKHLVDALQHFQFVADVLLPGRQVEARR